MPETVKICVELERCERELPVMCEEGNYSYKEDKCVEVPKEAVDRLKKAYCEIKEARKFLWDIVEKRNEEYRLETLRKNEEAMKILRREYAIKQQKKNEKRKLFAEWSKDPSLITIQLTQQTAEKVELITEFLKKKAKKEEYIKRNHERVRSK